MEKNLGGVWTWLVDSDDFRGECKFDPTAFADYPKSVFQVNKATTLERDFPLLRTINRAMEMLSNKRNGKNSTHKKALIKLFQSFHEAFTKL
jgi:hypothetical protein